MRRYWTRHQAAGNRTAAAKAGLGAVLGLGLVAWIGHETGAPLLIAPLGATAVLLFSVPDSPLSQPANVIGGHALATLLALALAALLPDLPWWSAPLAVGLAIAAMAVARLTHPPAGATPLVVLQIDPGVDFLVVTIGCSAALVAIAVLVHKLPPRRPYPLPFPPDYGEPGPKEALARRKGLR